MFLDRVNLFHSFYYIGPSNFLDLSHNLSIHASLSCFSLSIKGNFFSNSHSCPNRSHECLFHPQCQSKTWFPKIMYFRDHSELILFANKRKALKLSRKGGLWEATKGARNNQQLATLCSLIWQHVVNKTAKVSITLTEYNYCVSLIQLTMNTQGWLTQSTCFQNKHFGFKMVQTIHSVACGPKAAVTVFNTEFFFLSV